VVYLTADCANFFESLPWLVWKTEQKIKEAELEQVNCFTCPSTLLEKSFFCPPVIRLRVFLTHQWKPHFGYLLSCLFISAFKRLLFLVVGHSCKMQRATNSFIMSVHPHVTNRPPLDRFSWRELWSSGLLCSARVQKTIVLIYFTKEAWHLADFHETWYLSIFWKCVKKSQVWLKSYKNNGYLTWRPMYIHNNISLSS